MCNCCTKVENIQFIIGDNQQNTPPDGSNTYINTSLKYEPYLVFRNGKGFLHEGVHYNRVGSGGFQLTGNDKFDQSTEWTIILN